MFSYIKINLEWYRFYAKNDYKEKQSIFIYKQKQKLDFFQ